MLEARPTMKERYNSPLLLTGVFGRTSRFLTSPAAEGNVRMAEEKLSGVAGGCLMHPLK
jgi:hypothetical protein